MDKAAWIEVALTVTPEQAEAVAEVLGRFTREGVVIEQLADQNTRQEKTILKPEVRVYGYFFNDETVEDRKKRVDEALWYLGRIQPLPPAQYREIHDQDWMEAWKAALRTDHHRQTAGDPARLDRKRISRAAAHPHQSRHGLRHRHAPHHAVMP